MAKVDDHRAQTSHLSSLLAFQVPPLMEHIIPSKSDDHSYQVLMKTYWYSSSKDNDNYGPYSDPSLSPWIKERMEADMYKPYQV
eukprot:jgi/Psemu1/29171/gm1.29171_g